jgi:hypothetical protein
MVLFECDRCVFRKLYHRHPSFTNPVDSLALVTIRRSNLDAMWARTKATVEGNASLVARGLWNSKELGLTGPYLDAGPFPDYDH